MDLSELTKVIIVGNLFSNISSRYSVWPENFFDGVDNLFLLTGRVTKALDSFFLHDSTAKLIELRAKAIAFQNVLI